MTLNRFTKQTIRLENAAVASRHYLINCKTLQPIAYQPSREQNPKYLLHTMKYVYKKKNYILHNKTLRYDFIQFPVYLSYQPLSQYLSNKGQLCFRQIFL